MIKSRLTDRLHTFVLLFPGTRRDEYAVEVAALLARIGHLRALVTMPREP